MCPTHHQEQDRTSPKCRLARLYEASSLLDKIHTTLNSPTAEHAFNMGELILTVQTLINLETILTVEIRDGIQLYAGGLGLCNTWAASLNRFEFVNWLHRCWHWNSALLLAFENGTKVPLTADATENCNFIATTSLISVLSTITSIVELFTLGTQSIDFNFLPPFVTFLVYKAAVIVTERLLMDSDWNEKMRKLKILRNFLRIVGERWLACGELSTTFDKVGWADWICVDRYLKVLNEDTTPRTLKAIE
jgi:hypothetical protein